MIGQLPPRRWVTFPSGYRDISWNCSSANMQMGISPTMSGKWDSREVIVQNGWGLNSSQNPM